MKCGKCGKKVEDLEEFFILETRTYGGFKKNRRDRKRRKYRCQECVQEVS